MCWADPPVLLVQVGVLSQHRADRGGRRRFDDGLGRGREDRGVQVGVAMDERAVDPCPGGNGGDADLGPGGVHVGQRLVDSLPATVDVTAAGLGKGVRDGHGLTRPRYRAA
jgi:hypothetical protein